MFVLEKSSGYVLSPVRVRFRVFREGNEGGRQGSQVLVLMLLVDLVEILCFVVELIGELPVEGNTEVWDSMSGTSFRYTGLVSVFRGELVAWVSVMSGRFTRDTQTTAWPSD
jgi:hypothetical protein